MLLLDYYYSKDSETKGNLVQSALKAGYSESTAITKAPRIIKRFGTAGAGESLNAVGVNKPYLAMRIRHVLENGGDKEILSAARLAYALLGEATDSGGSVTNTFNAPTMVIVGASQERIKALRGAIPQLSKEEQERLEDAATQERLEAFKRGEIPLVSRHSVATTGYTGWNENDPQAVPNVESRDVECAPEAQPDAG